MTAVPRPELLILAGAETIPASWRTAARQAVLAHRRSGGGFAGRAGEADLWYTYFALRALLLCGGREDLAGVGDWLRQACIGPPADAVELFCRAGCASLLRFAGIEAPSPESVVDEAGLGIQHRFLLLLARRLLGQADPPEAVAGFRTSSPDGEATNLIAARLGGLDLLGVLASGERSAGIAWLAARQQADGGLAAAAGLGTGDLLSTWSGVWTLAQLDALSVLRLGDLARFVAACRHPSGAFGALRIRPAAPLLQALTGQDGSARSAR